MTLEEMEKLQSENAQAVLQAAVVILSGYRSQPISPETWQSVMEVVWQLVEPAALRSAEIARDYYDSERAKAAPGIALAARGLAGVSFEVFLREMEPARLVMALPGSSASEVQQAALRAVRTVENAGRRTLIRAVEAPDDDFDRYAEFVRPSGSQPRSGKVVNLVRGWARVPTGKETCGFCWMLCSRGPVYSMEGAGVEGLEFSQAVQMAAAGELTSEHVKSWHTGCDCRVVPVFNEKNWPGMERYEAAWQLWKDVVWEGNYHGKGAINAYRRAVEAGDIQRLLEKTAKKAA